MAGNAAMNPDAAGELPGAGASRERASAATAAGWRMPRGEPGRGAVEVAER